ncbi:MAG: cytochrome oxidase subunit III, partial [Candidatus Tectomicrobia bacterium]|nr:cytochrome oxidase subunit III [Candidatus Tectomicrobia bacterium]
FGLTASSGVYGSTFYTIIGTHAFHVFCGVVWLLAVLVRAAVCCGMYWHLVVGLWPVLFILVYLI